MEEKTEEEVEDRYKKIFDAYLHLQTESYEMITRNVAIHDWLRGAYDALKEDPAMGIDEIYTTLNDNFWKIYKNLFAMFFRPFKVVTYPFGEIVEAQSEASTPKSLFDMYMGLLRIPGESQLIFLKGVSDILKEYGKETAGYGKEGDVTAQMEELMPLNLLRSMADEGAEAYLGMLNRLFGYLGESQFLVPKTFFVDVQNFFSVYSKIYGLWRRYELAFRNIWERSIRKLASRLNENKEIGFEEFFNLFREIFSEEYDELLRSKEFIDTQNKVRDALIDLIRYSERAMEAQIEMFPVLPFAPRREVDEIEKRIHNYMNISNALERRISEIEKKMENVEKMVGEGEKK